MELSPQVRKILYATDMSSNSAYAFGYALYSAKQYGAKIVMAHVFEPLPSVVRYHGSLQSEDDYYRTIKETTAHEIKARIERFCQKIDMNLGGCLEAVENIVTPLGHPVDEILKLADEEDCDLIVLGTHGKGLLKQTFLGSVSRAIIERSHKPVLAVPLPINYTGWADI